MSNSNFLDVSLLVLSSSRYTRGDDVLTRSITNITATNTATWISGILFVVLH